LLPAKTAEAANGAQTPTFGITFNDVLAWMMRERSQVSGGQGLPITVQPTQIVPVQAQPTAIPGIAQSTQTASAQSTAQPTHATALPPKPTPVPPATIPTGLDIGALLVPLTCGVVLLVLFVAVVRFVRKRRRDSGLV